MRRNPSTPLLPTLALVAVGATCIGCGSTSKATTTPTPMTLESLGTGPYILQPTAGTDQQTIEVPSTTAKKVLVEITCQSSTNNATASAQLNNNGRSATITAACGNGTTGSTTPSTHVVLITHKPGPLTVSTSDAQVKWIVAIEGEPNS